MAKKDIKFTLDTIDSRYSPVGTVKQLDSVFFHIKITENGVTKDLTGQTIKLFAIKEDKKIVEQTTKINITNQREGLVEIELLNAAIQVHGFTYFELEISDSNGIISIADFILRVNKRVGSDEAIESTNEVSTLKKVEAYVAKAKVELEEFKKIQSEILSTNGEINTQESLRAAAETKRIQAEETRIEADNLRDKKMTEFSKSFEAIKNGENLEDSSIKFRHISQELFDDDYVYEINVKNTNPDCQIAPLFDFSKLGDSVNVKLVITLLEGDTQDFHLRCTSTDYINGGDWTALKFSGEKRIRIGETKELSLNFTKEIEKKYFAPLIAGLNGNFKIQVKFILNDLEVYPLNLILPQTNVDDTCIKKALNSIPKSALATQEFVKEEDLKILNKAKDYTNNFKFSLEDNSVGLENLKENLFILSEEFKFKGINEHIFITSDLSILGKERTGKTVLIEYEAFAENLSVDSSVTLYEKVGVGRTYWEYHSPVYVKQCDIKNRMHKGSIEYTINSIDEYKYILFYPQIILSASGATCDVSIRKLKITCEGVEIPVLGRRGQDDELIQATVLEKQKGTKLAKQEYVLKVIDEKTNGYDTKMEQLNADIVELRGLMGGNESVVESVLNGKKGSFIGDSITFGTGTSDVETKPYCKLISKKYSMISNNCAMPGYTLSRKDGIGSFFDLYSRVTKDSNYITILGGVNDYGNDVPLGSFSDSTDETFYGAMKLHCEKLLTDYPDSKVAFMTAFQDIDCNKPNKAGHKLIDYVNAMIVVANHYGIDVLDLYRTSGLCPDFQQNKNKYYSDNVHLNDAGHERVFVKISKFLEAL